MNATPLGDEGQEPQPARSADGAPPRRLCPERPLPDYAYVPGRHPHPLKDPAGHSFGHVTRPAPLPQTEAFWATHRWACDLWQQGYPWEAHEAWEELWHLAPPRSALAAALQGLIQAAAAHLKRVQSLPRAEARLLAAARERLGEGAAAGVVLGLDLAALGEDLERWHREGAAWPPLPFRQEDPL